MLKIFLIFMFLSVKAYAGEESSSKEYVDDMFAKVSDEQNVPVKLLRAICWAESHHNPAAFNKGDGSGNNHAFGICQVLHSTARENGFKDENCYKDFTDSITEKTYKGCKLFGIYINITYGAKYLKEKLDRYDGSWISAIAAYNSGTLKTCKTGVVRRVKDKSILYTCKKGGLLNQRYVDRVLEAINEGK